MHVKSLSLSFLLLLFFRALLGTTIHIPLNYPSIQAGINASSSGDTVLVAPGTYAESVTLSHKVVLASWYINAGDDSYISTTTIDAGGADFGISIPQSASDGSSIIGFSIKNADDGIRPYRRFNLLHCHLSGTADGVDYSTGSGGLCQFNIFENNSDDGVDLDGKVDIVIADNIIRNNGNDGIEIRLHAYSGSNVLNCVITRNNIYNNTGDGIQLIDYNNPEITNRKFFISYNYIHDNVQAGLGCMGNANTDENYEGASIEEGIHLFNNTFDHNAYGLTGGDNLVALNNIFANSTNAAVRRVDGNSVVAYSLFYNNGVNNDNSNVDDNSTILGDPSFGPNLQLQAGSPAIDAGIAQYTWQSNVVLNLAAGDYSGTAPDRGAYEFYTSTGLLPKILSASNVQFFPNPFREKFSVKIDHTKSTRMSVRVINAMGQTIFSGKNYPVNEAVEINADEWASGYYYFLFTTDDGFTFQLKAKKS
ncbi:MAG: right-handed parallel beta-helix repeat-containing protein [Bacteroidia bacterium]